MKTASRASIAVALAAAVFAQGRAANAQGCVCARASTPGFGARGAAYLSRGDVLISAGYRWQYSQRHFVDGVEDRTREIDGSAFINNVHLLELSATYAVDERFSVSVNLPYLIGERSAPIRNSRGQVIDRNVTHGRGVGDIQVVGRWWLLGPRRNPTHNISFGLGLKLPTGETAQVNTIRQLQPDDRTFAPVTQPIDPSIQPGDGGFGVVLELAAFQSLGDGALYVSGTYLLNPRDTNGTLYPYGREGESVLSVTDQYLLRFGASYSVPFIPGLGASLGVRWEGVPPIDLIGASNGFRRPGFAVSADPGITYVHGSSAVSLNVPVAIYRERQRSLTELVLGDTGDAAFADYIILLGYSVRF